MLLFHVLLMDLLVVLVVTPTIIHLMEEYITTKGLANTLTLKDARIVNFQLKQEILRIVIQYLLLVK